MLDGKELHRGDLLRGTGYWMKAEVVLRAALHKMHEDPYYFVDKAEAGVTT